VLPKCSRVCGVWRPCCLHSSVALTCSLLHPRALQTILVHISSTHYGRLEMVASTRRNPREFRCRWDWCTATLASHDALRAHFAAEHEPALAPVTRREAAAMNAMSMGLLSDGDDSMREWPRRMYARGRD
jgi:hypothetical protein